VTDALFGRGAAGSGSRWTLRDDPELDTHWLPRARGVEPDSEGTGWYFSGRSAAVQRIARFLASPHPVREPLVLIGEPGSGKSALLAHVLVLADPFLRRQVPERYRGKGSEPLADAVDVAVYAKDKDVPSVVREVAAAAGLATDDPARLLVGLRSRSRPFRIVVDALDEAKPEHINGIAVLVRQLARDPDRLGIRVMVSVRRSLAGSDLDRITRQ
jgi:hypothetical protein